MNLKINFGCGQDKRKGYLNLDKTECDLNALPTKFKENIVHKIYFSHVLEHVDDPVGVLQEFHRILKPGGILVIKVPHFSAAGSYTPFHKTYWNSKAFINFEKGMKEFIGSDEHFDLFKIDELKIRFFKGFLLWNYPLQWVVNQNRVTQGFYEMHFSRLFPAREILCIF